MPQRQGHLSLEGHRVVELWRDRHQHHQIAIAQNGLHGLFAKVQLLNQTAGFWCRGLFVCRFGNAFEFDAQTICC